MFIVVYLYYLMPLLVLPCGEVQNVSSIVNICIAERTYNVTHVEEESCTGDYHSSITFLDLYGGNNAGSTDKHAENIEVENCVESFVSSRRLNNTLKNGGASTSKQAVNVFDHDAIASQENSVGNSGNQKCESRKNVGKKCSAMNCSIPRAPFHTFPIIISKGIVHKDNFARCREWIRMSGNHNLLGIPSSKLNNRRFLCSCHFETNQYYRVDRKRLKPNAIPTIFENGPLSDEAMKLYPVMDEDEKGSIFIDEVISEIPIERTCVGDYLVDGIVFDLPQSNVMECNESLVPLNGGSGDGIAHSTSDINTESVFLLSGNGELHNVVSMSMDKVKSKTAIKSPCVDENAMNCIVYDFPQSHVMDFESFVPLNEGSGEGIAHHGSEINMEFEPLISANGGNEEDVTATFEEPNVENNVDVIEPSTSKSNEKCTKRKVICCFHGCSNSSMKGSMFHFPQVVQVVYGQKRINDANLRRFVKWIEASGNVQLTLLDPIAVYKKFFVCASHFEPNCFMNARRLKNNAIPSLNISKLLSCRIGNEYKQTLNVWKENPDIVNVFSSNASIASAFEESMTAMHWVTCLKCFEKRLSNLKDGPSCQHFSRCWQFTAANNMDPLEVPEELQGLTYIEEQLIARVHPVISIFKLKGLQFGYRGNIINFAQNVNEIATKLPLQVKDLNSILTVTYNDMEGKCHDFHVRSDKIRKALIWLKRNNEFYYDIEISEENLRTLPEDGDVFNEIPSIFVSENESNGTCHEESEEAGSNTDMSNESGNIHSSCVPNLQVPHQDKQIENKIMWPTMTTKIDEFNTRGYMVCAFPSLYPHGKADYLETRTSEVKAAAYFRHMLSYHDRRFVKHSTYRFFALNSWMRWTGLNDGNIFVRNNEEFRNMTVSKLKDMLQENPSLIKKIMFQASNLKGTNAYWHSKSGELKDMVEQIGLPTIFLTLSCADGHWEDLFKLLANTEDVSNLTESERRKLVQENPDIVDTFFHMRVESFVTNVLQKKYKVKDYWYRVEYQHRGSPHVHGVFWFDGAPDVRNLKNASDEERCKVIDYFSELVTAVNPNIDVGEPNTHPCRTSYQNIIDVQEDLAQLLLKVQRHTKCSTDYCIRVNKKTKVKECRFKFPREMQDKATLEEGDNGELEFKPERNDPLLKKFNEFFIQLWRANIDIAPVISEKALLAYLTKYISKSEIKSQALQEIVNEIFATIDDDSTAKKIHPKIVHEVMCREGYFSTGSLPHNVRS